MLCACVLCKELCPVFILCESIKRRIKKGRREVPAAETLFLRTGKGFTSVALRRIAKPLFTLLMFDRKAAHVHVFMCVQDPPWVNDKAYYKVAYKPNWAGRWMWMPEKIKLETLFWSSIFPTKEQLKQFERSPAFLDMIFQVRALTELGLTR